MKWLEEEYKRRLYVQSSTPDFHDLLGAVVFAKKAEWEMEEFRDHPSSNLVFGEGTTFEITLAELRAGCVGSADMHADSPVERS